MSKRKTRNLLLALSYSAFLYLSAGAAQYEEISFNGNGSYGPYVITSRQIAVGSDSVWIGDSLLKRNDHYEIEYDRGLIYFSNPAAVDDTIRVKFIPIYFKIRDSYSLYKPVPIDLKAGFVPDSLSSGASSIRSSPRMEPGLNIGGSKSLSVEFGSGLNPDVSQALDLSIHGPVVRGVTADAYVSDKGTPAATGGSSTIEELDKFFINLSAEHFTATLGDYYVDFERLRLSGYYKKLQGVKLEYDDGFNRISASGASSSGRVTVNRISGREGDQGPYFLADPSGARDFSVLPGTETVYLDGEKLIRGSDNDYTIDYQKGYVTFTPRRLITSDSRIEIEFEYSSREYSRGFYTSRAGKSTSDGRFRFGGGFIAEADDKSRPLNLSLTDEDKQLIREGGGGEFAFKSGVTYVGDSLGDYNRVTDSTGYIYYVYAGADSGSYDVVFSNVSAGDYIYIGRGIYEFTGVGKGDYAPVIKLPIPKAQYLYSVDGSYSSGNGVDLNGELAYSRHDQNLFSGGRNRHDEPAVILDGLLSSAVDLPVLPDTFSVTGKYRHTGKNFAPFTEFRQADYYNKWNLPIDYQAADEDETEGGAIFGYAGRYRFSFAGGCLSRRDISRSYRWSAGSDLKLPGGIDIDGEYRESRYDVDSSSDTVSVYDESKLQEGRSHIEYREWIFRPSLGYRYRNDVRRDGGLIQDGQRHNIYEAGLGILPGNGISNSLIYSIQHDDQYENLWLRKDETVTITEKFGLSGFPRGLNLNYQYTYRHKKFKELPGTDSRQNLSYLTTGYFSDPLVISYDHRYNRTRSALKIQRYVKVEEGTGDYRFDNGEYVPDPFGDYILILEEAGEYRPVSEVDNTVRIRLNGKHLGDRIDLLNNIRLENTIEFKRKTEETGIRFIDLVNPWRNVDRELIIDDNLQFISDLFYIPPRESMTREVRFRYRQNRVNRGGGNFAGEFDDERAGSVRIKQILGGGLSLKMEYTREHQRVTGIGDLMIFSDVYDPDLTYSPTPAVEAGTGLKYRHDREDIDAFAVDLLSVQPHLRWNISNNGRLDINGEISRVWSEEKQYFSYRIAEGNKAGENYRLTVRGILKLGENSNGEMTYNFRKLSGDEGRHFFRTQVKYVF